MTEGAPTTKRPARPSAGDIDRELVRKYGALPSPRVLDGGKLISSPCTIPDLRPKPLEVAAG